MVEAHKKFYMTSTISSDMDSDERFYLEVFNCLERYNKNDWGDLCEEDKKANETALKYGGMILATYMTSKGKIYIITDDAGVSKQTVTILYPEEY